MKKLAIATLLVLAAGTASAVEVGVTLAHQAGVHRTGEGFTIGQSFDKFGVTGGFERFTQGSNDQTRYSVIGSYPFAKVKMVTFSALGGGAFLVNQHSENGFALVGGVGASMPLAKNVTLGLDITRQEGQHSVAASSVNKMTASVKYAF